MMLNTNTDCSSIKQHAGQREEEVVDQPIVGKPKEVVLNFNTFVIAKSVIAHFAYPY